MDENNLIPPNHEGKQIDLIAEKKFSDTDAVKKGFELAAQRLLHPRLWKELCGSGSASFEVLGADLEIKSHAISEGDYIRINVPGPGPGSGDGYDWVKVVMVRSSDDVKRYLGIKLVPCANPHELQKAASHFFSKRSSSTLTVQLEGLKVSATYHGRNETINNDTGSRVENLRNTLVGAGALAGLSELQWKRLITALVDE